MTVLKDKTQPIAIFWFRRDLRLNDNTGLFYALNSGFKVLPVFIFDAEILKNLNTDDPRVSFIYQTINNLKKVLLPYNSSIQLFHGKPVEVFEQLISKYSVKAVFANHDYEPYALERDQQIAYLLSEKGISFNTLKDQVIFEKNEITKSTGEPYTVFTPYSHRWLEKLNQNSELLNSCKSEDFLFNLIRSDQNTKFELESIGFKQIIDVFHPFKLNTSEIATYDQTRNFPALDTTSRVGVHLRFGTISVRHLVANALKINSTWLNELIWREFFMQILWHFPFVVHQSFKPKYRFISWVNNEEDFKAWCIGQTGYPLVDAGMRELNATGFMHNRVRMVTASFLVKHLLVNWQWGEAYFAEKLMDFELSSNNGNWQWAAGTGCDAAPYFRIFNPMTQAEKFDPEQIYIKKWVPEYGEKSYPLQIIDHSFARERCLQTYKAAL